MTSAKKLFLRKEPGKQSLAEWWTSICHDERFVQVLTYARADAFERHMPYEHLVGAGEMLDTLMTFSESEETFAEFPSPHLQHHMPAKQHQETQKRD